MKLVTLDMETYYSREYSLSRMTTQEYIDHDDFEVIGVAAKVGAGETAWCSGDWREVNAFLKSLDLENSMVCCHNAMFDGGILSRRFSIYPGKLMDTLSMARAVHGTEVGGSLAKLVTHYDLGAKGTEVVDAMGLKRKAFSQQQLDQYGQYCINDVELTYKLLFCLLPHFNKTELDLIDITIKMYTDPHLVLDEWLLEEHLETVRARKEELLAACGVDRESLMSNIKLADTLMDLGVDPPMKISKATGKAAYAFAKSDEEFKALLDYPDETVQAVVAARLGVKSTLEETRTERFIKIAQTRHNLPIPLKYYGAHTGRWSATEKINMQNLPRDSALKKGIQAPAGHVLIGVDLSNIELRVNMFLAGEQAPLEILASGRDLYREFGSMVFGVPPEEIDKDQRFISKTAVLGLGFGAGAAVLRRAIKIGSGKDIGDEEAIRIVKLYRETYPKLVELWGVGQRTIRSVHTDRRESYGFGSLQLEVHGRQGIQLPSGLYLKYPGLKESRSPEGKSEWTYNGGRGAEHTRIYGPKVTQNITQAVARCVMAEAIPRVHKKYRVVNTIHDAVYCIAPKEEAQEAFDFVVGEMTKAPEWAWGLPLAAEGLIGRSLKDV
jgi:DNA polymerase